MNMFVSAIFNFKGWPIPFLSRKNPAILLMTSKVPRSVATRDVMIWLPRLIRDFEDLKVSPLTVGVFYLFKIYLLAGQLRLGFILAFSSYEIYLTCFFCG